MASRPATLPDRLRFGEDFELDVRAYELRSRGIPLRLRPVVMEILILLIERRGELVTREEIVERIWGKNRFLDTDNNINGAIRKIRQVLRDDAEQPRFVQTVTGKGYRFVASVATIGEPAAEAAAAVHVPQPEDVPVHRPADIRKGLLLATVVVLAAAGVIYWRWFREHARPAVPPGRIMLAVLPFENLTGDASQEYFSDGLTEEMITELGRVDPQRLGVIARTSVMLYKQKPEALDQVGRELGVQYVIEGSVRRDSDNVRITAQLIRVKDQTHVWAKAYDRELKNLLVLQREIAQEIADEIQLELGDQHRASAVRHTAAASTSYEAYDLYLKGRYFWNMRTEVGFHRAADYFQQAIGKDPSYAPAYAGLADTFALMSTWQQVPQNEFMPKARAAALKALQIDPNLAEGHASLALVAENYDYDWQTAEKEFQRAIQLDPGYATAHQWYAEYLSWQGRFDEALAESDRARQLDPLSLIIAADHCAILYFSRQYSRAIAQCRAVMDIDPSTDRAVGFLVDSYVQEGSFAEALDKINHFIRPLSVAWSWGAKHQSTDIGGTRKRPRTRFVNLSSLCPKRIPRPWTQGLALTLIRGGRIRLLPCCKKPMPSIRTSLRYSK